MISNLKIRKEQYFEYMFYQDSIGLSIIALTGGQVGEEFTTKNELMIRLRG